jgi:hypothetical protein
MHGTVALRGSTSEKTDTVIPFGTTGAAPVTDGADLLDSAGNTILGMLGRAADATPRQISPEHYAPRRRSTR